MQSLCSPHRQSLFTLRTMSICCQQPSTWSSPSFNGNLLLMTSSSASRQMQPCGASACNPLLHPAVSTFCRDLPWHVTQGAAGSRSRVMSIDRALTSDRASGFNADAAEFLPAAAGGSGYVAPFNPQASAFVPGSWSNATAPASVRCASCSCV